jgi:hypothetical protein
MSLSSLLAFAFAVPPFVLALLAMLAPHAMALVFALLLMALGWVGLQAYKIRNARVRHVALVATLAVEQGIKVVKDGLGDSVPGSAADAEAKVLAAALGWLKSGKLFSQLKADYALSDADIEAALGEKVPAPTVLAARLAPVAVPKEIVPLADAKPGDGSPTRLVRPRA